MFHLIKIENARQNVPEPEWYPATASEAIVEGEALVLSSGKLTKCGASAKPTFVAMKALSASATDRNIPVIRVEENQLYEVATSADCSAVALGTKVTIHTDAASVTATSGGACEIVDLLDAAASGDPVIVRFVAPDPVTPAPTGDGE